ncbi:MAG: PTS sugar transporter subunit IIA [Bdellovibrionales bacterium]
MIKTARNRTKDTQFNLIVPNAKIKTHNDALLMCAEKAAEHLNISQERVLKRINEREDMNNSAIGNGVAIPNVKMRRVQKPFTMLMTLDQDITYDTPDNTPLNMYAFLISPTSDGPIHLRRLSRLSRLLLQDSLRQRIRETKDEEIIQSLLMDPEGWLIAA